MLKIAFCRACLDFINVNCCKECQQVYENLAEQYVIIRYPLLYSNQSRLKKYYDFLEQHGFIVTTECDLDFYHLKPLGMQEIDEKTFRFCQQNCNSIDF